MFDIRHWKCNNICNTWTIKEKFKILAWFTGCWVILLHLINPAEHAEPYKVYLSGYFLYCNYTMFHPFPCPPPLLPPSPPPPIKKKKILRLPPSKNQSLSIIKAPTSKTKTLGPSSVVSFIIFKGGMNAMKSLKSCFGNTFPAIFTCSKST